MRAFSTIFLVICALALIATITNAAVTFNFEHSYVPFEMPTQIRITSTKDVDLQSIVFTTVRKDDEPNTVSVLSFVDYNNQDIYGAAYQYGNLLCIDANTKQVIGRLLVSSAQSNSAPIITPISTPFIFNYHQYYAFRIERFGSIQRQIDSLVVTDELHNGEVYSLLIVQSYRAKVHQPFIIFVPAFDISYTSSYTVQLDVGRNYIGLTEGIVISHICPALAFYTVPIYITPFTNIAQFLYHDSNFFTQPDEDYFDTFIINTGTSIEYRPPFNFHNGFSFEVYPFSLPLGQYNFVVSYKSPVLPNEGCAVETPFELFPVCEGVKMELALPNDRTEVTLDEIISGIPVKYNYDTLDVNSFIISDMIGHLHASGVPLQLPLHVEIDSTLPSTLRIKLAESVDVSTIVNDSYMIQIEANIINQVCQYLIQSLITIEGIIKPNGIITIHPSTLPHHQLAFTKDLPLTTTNPLILTNSIQLQVGYNFTINGDVNFLPNIKANITLQYYPLIGQNDYSTHPITIITQSITNLQSSTTLLTIPKTTHTTHRAEIVIQYNNSTIVTLTTIPFSILSSCYISPTTITSTTIVNDWTTTCNNNNNNNNLICLPSGQCSSSTTIPPINNNDDGDDDIPIHHCSKCITSHTNKCDSTTNNQCQCQTNFIGQYCEQLQQCQEQTQLQCGNNGYITYDPITLECNENDNNNECQCYNYWIGNKCQQCDLQCLNNGKRYINCDKCGCDKGYSGINCQCQTNIGIMTLNGYSEIYNAYQLILNKEKDLELKSILLYELKDNADTLLNNIIITLQQLLQFDPNESSIKLQLQQINNPNYNNNINNDNDNDDDDDDDDTNTTNETIIEVQYYTTFKLTMQFNCDGYNSNLSLDELLQRWESLQLKLLSSPIIQQYFIFSTNSSPQLEITELQPIDDTLPAADQEYKDAPNNAIIPSLLFNFYLSSILPILLAMVLFYQM